MMALATALAGEQRLIDALYVVAVILFILGLRALSAPGTAVRGNKLAAVGMAIAFATTLLTGGMFDHSRTLWLVALGLVAGTAVGIPAALYVKMPAIPQMVAMFNGVGGGAVALIAWAEYRRRFPGPDGALWAPKAQIPSLFAAIIGSISFWGSNIAFAKLQGILSGRPIRIPGQAVLNAVLAVVVLASAVALASGVHSEALFAVGVLVAAAALASTLVLRIGGADMPVVISFLNAFTGLSAAAMGIALDNIALIVAGILVGASGSILTNLMAVAMNRSVPAILAGGFGSGGSAAGNTAAVVASNRPVRSTSAADVAIQLAFARQVVVVPGYGMAVAQAQHAVRELTQELERRGSEVKFAIHPVAGRMPGHMNVLLAEADIPYEQLKEMDEINPEFSRTDIALVIGANDVTNPAANTNPDSPIYGMPILEVSRSRSVIVLKRSLNAGYAGIENELYHDPKTALLFGDAKASVAEIAAEVARV